MNPFRLGMSSSASKQKQKQERKQPSNNPPGDKLILIQEFIRILPNGAELVLDRFTLKNIPQDLNVDKIMTTVQLEDGTVLTTD